jgi:hypothetical protein
MIDLYYTTDHSLPTYKVGHFAGVMHDERYTAIPQLSLRDFVLLRHEPENPVDANAILVKHKTVSSSAT